jgi:type IX secretion system PorP/SprF family membrane protein
MAITDAPQTIMAAVDADLSGGSNLGLIFANDRIGPTFTNSIMLGYAFRFPITEKGRLAFGLSGGAIYYGLDNSKINRPDDWVSWTTEPNTWKPQIDAGIYVDWPDFYAGFSAMGLLPNKAKDSTLQIMRAVPTWFLTFGGMVHFNEIWSLAPSALLKTDFKSPLSMDLTAMMVFSETLWLGLTYRTGLNFTYSGRTDSPDVLRQTNALVVIAEVYIMDNIRLGVAHDFDLNSLATGYNGGIEVSLGYYILKSSRKYSTPRYF